MSLKLFISYSVKDEQFVKELATKLRDDTGGDVWFAYWSLKVGDSIIDRINEGIDKSSFFIIVFSPTSIESNWVRRELNAALIRQLKDDDIKILPVMLDCQPGDLPPLFQDIVAAKFSRERISSTEYEKLSAPLLEISDKELFEQFKEEFFDVAQILDGILENPRPSESQVRLALDKLEQDERYSRYFFEKVDSPVWFDILDHRNFFQPGPFLAPRQTEHGVLIPSWPQLKYLEKLTEKSTFHEDLSVVDKLINSIVKLADYRLPDGQHIDNEYVWQSCLRILSQVPPERIPFDLVNKMDMWLDSQFNNTLCSIEIFNKLLPTLIDSASIKDCLLKAERLFIFLTALKRSSGTFPDRKISKGLQTRIDPYWLQTGVEGLGKRISKLATEQVLNSIKANIKLLLNKDSSRVEIETQDETCEILLYRNNRNLMVDIVQQGTLVETASWAEDETDAESFTNELLVILKSRPILSDHNDGNITYRLHHLYLSMYAEGCLKSLMEHPRHRSQSPLDILTEIFKKLLTETPRNDDRLLEKMIRDLLRDRYLYFQKLAAYIIGTDTCSFGKLFFESLSDRRSFLLWEDLYFGDELRVILENLSHQPDSMSNDDRLALEQVIKQGSRLSFFEQDKQVARSKWRQKRYHALRNDAYFASRYESEQSVTREDNLQLVPALRIGYSGWVHHKSPRSENELLELSNEQLASFLKEYKGSGTFEGHSREGLSGTFRAVVTKTPEKFTVSLSPFLDAPARYVYDLLRGLDSAHREGQELDWDAIISFLESYGTQDSFWTDEDNGDQEESLYNANRNSIAGVIGELLESGTKDDETAFSYDLNDRVACLIEMLIERLPAKQIYPSEPMTQALNSSHGKLISAYVNLALRDTRVCRQNNTDAKWKEPQQKFYDSLLSRGVEESFTYLGFYLPNFCYLDRTWADTKIAVSHSFEGSLWFAFMTGYSSTNRFYDDLYKRMSQNYVRAIRTLEADKSILDTLIQHTALAHLRGLESEVEIEESSYQQIIRSQSLEQVASLIHYLWQFCRELAEEDINRSKKTSLSADISSKVVETWRSVYARLPVNRPYNDDYKNLLASLSLLTIALTKLDLITVEWLRACAPYADRDHDSYFFLAYLDALKDSADTEGAITALAEILMITEIRYLSEFHMKPVRSIVRFLYQSKYEKAHCIADKICNDRFDQDNELRDLYLSNR